MYVVVSNCTHSQYLPGINCHNPHPCRDKLFPQRIGEGSDGGFAGAVDLLLYQHSMNQDVHVSFEARE